MPLQLDRLLETALNKNATETWLVVGKPPMFRVDGVFRHADIPPITSSDIEKLFEAEAAAHAAYVDTGIVDLPVRYGQIATFIATLLKTPDGPFALLRLQPQPQEKHSTFTKQDGWLKPE